MFVDVYFRAVINCILPLLHGIVYMLYGLLLLLCRIALFHHTKIIICISTCVVTVCACVCFQPCEQHSMSLIRTETVTSRRRNYSPWWPAWDRTWRGGRSTRWSGMSTLTVELASYWRHPVCMLRVDWRKWSSTPRMLLPVIFNFSRFFPQS